MVVRTTATSQPQQRHSSRGVVVSLCGVNLHVPKLSVCLSYLLTCLFTSLAHLKNSCFFLIESYGSFIYPGCKFFIGYVICKYSPLVWVLFFHSLNNVFCKAEVLNFDVVQMMLSVTTKSLLYPKSHFFHIFF